MGEKGGEGGKEKMIPGISEQRAAELKPALYIGFMSMQIATCIVAESFPPKHWRCLAESR